MSLSVKERRSETIHSEVTQMGTKARIQAIRLMEMLQKDPVYGWSLGIQVDMKEQLPCLTGPELPAEICTER